MGTIAKGEITLSPVNDAYTVSITPASCPIRASYDGSNPQLSAAKGNISVKMGNEDVSFRVCRIQTSSADIEVECSRESAINVPFQLSAISTSDSEGWVEFDITTTGLNVYTTTVRFNFSVIRETTLLDWVMDWDGSKTKIGGTYIMTPKLFVGKKEDVAITQEDESVDWKENAITGVYIGPDLLATGEKSIGIYGYLNSSEIFHINAEGGKIGGWTINDNGFQSSNGVFNILSEGTIFAKSSSLQEPYWKLNSDGSAVFAKGNVKFSADGSAEFKGKITSSLGKIGGWSLTTNQLNNNRVILDSKEGCIAINATEFLAIDINTGDLSTSMDNGVKLWYKSKTSYGLAGYNDGEKVFYIGSSNFIGGWNFNNQAIWTGDTAPQLNAHSYTAEGALTLAPNGIRSNKWYIDGDGTAAFVGDKVKFGVDNAEMFGWLLRDKRFSSPHAALIADSSYSGLFVSTADLSEVGQYSLVNTIKNSGGIFLYSDGANSIMKSYDKQGNVGFFLSTSGYNQIGNWYFDHTSIYTGNRNLDDNGFANDSNSIVLSTEGLRGKLWKFLADGSGAVAGNNIKWDAEGNVTFSANVQLSWEQITGTDGIASKLTHIDANGIYTGTISADNITAGTIATASVKSEGKWALNQDGSGYLASQKITWDSLGTLNIKGHITVETLRYLAPITDDVWGNGDSGAWTEDGLIVDTPLITANLGGDHIFKLPHLEKGEVRIVKYIGSLISRSGGSVIFKVANSNDDIVIGTDVIRSTRYKELNCNGDALNYGIGYFELVGRGGCWGEDTVWHIIKL